jgi:hypothetical protein
MNNPTYTGRSFHGQALLLAAAVVMLGLPAGPGTSVQVDSFTRAFSRRAAVARQPAPAAVYVESSGVLPPFPSESAGPSPGRSYAWVPGYYRWAASHGGFHWVWFKGHYEFPPSPGAEWMAPHFEDSGSSMIYVGGYWRIP